MLKIFTRNACRISSSREAIKRLASTVTKESESVPKNVQNDSVLKYRFIYPEFLPDPKVEFRNTIREKLERNDMIARRTQVSIPEFYVGSIMAVESADFHTPGQMHRFVGICIHREGCGLRAQFILRNIIDHQGIEIIYNMYDPSIHKVEVLRLEKRLDDKLFYLRDALPEYCTFDPKMQPEILPAGAAIPVNPIKVKLKQRPWLERWERQNLQGVQDLGLPEKFYKRAEELSQPWEKYDLMKEYKRTIPAEEQAEIFSDVQSRLKQIEDQTKQMKRKRIFVKPTKSA